MADDTLIFVDGENISSRYHAMVKAGHKPLSDNIIIGESFVWNHRILKAHVWNLKRLSYYTSVEGDDPKILAVRKEISAIAYRTQTGEGVGSNFLVRSGQIIPFIRKKNSRSHKESFCDIAIAVDVMRACYRDHAQTILILSGDGDFIQLFQEVVHSGKIVYASAFSSGLCPEIPLVVDEFILLDDYFFEKPSEKQPK